MDKVQCFWVVDSGRDKLALRRYVSSGMSKCSGEYGYHNASVDIGEEATNDGAIESRKGGPPAGYENDPRWPTCCSCGYVFQPEDPWQLFRSSIYRREDTGEEWTQMNLPAGAMYDAHWLKRVESWKTTGPDGLALHVVCPPGNNWGDHWHVDGPANNGPGWTRTGTVPNISAMPSIQTPRYHGHLRNGVLERC